MKRFFLAAFLVTAVFAPALFAQTRTPVTLPDTVRGAWGKGIRCTITAPNILGVRGSTANDVDQINMNNIPFSGAQTLVVVVKSMSGRFPWEGGKMYGLTVNNKQIVPEGRVVTDHMIVGPMTVGEPLRFSLAGVTGATINIGLRVYSGAQYELEFWYE
ncbi:MAG: hypothetical protein LBU88_00780 [Treponema sp.]|nr:hypothetical protein [Treponema sp.]